MKLKNILAKTIIFEEHDFSRLHLNVYVNLNEEYLILQRNEQRYICRKRRDEYVVLGVYNQERKG